MEGGREGGGREGGWVGWMDGGREPQGGRDAGQTGRWGREERRGSGGRAAGVREGGSKKAREESRVG